MKKKKNLLRVIFFCAVSAFIVACGDAIEENETPPPAIDYKISVKEPVINLRTDETSALVVVDTNIPDWVAKHENSNDASWLEIIPSIASKNVALRVSVNDNIKTRSAAVIIGSKDGKTTTKVTLSQLGTEPDLLVSKTEFVEVEKLMSTITITVTTNAPYEITFSDSWILEQKSKAIETYNHIIVAAANVGALRMGSVTVSTKGLEKNITKSFKVYQKGTGGDIVIGEELTRNILKVFNTEACAKLVDNVKDADIASLPAMLQDIAMKMKNGDYKSEYRVGTYIAHSSPEFWATKLRTMKWGQADNPTGIWAELGDKIYLFVDETWGNTIKLFSCHGGVSAGGDDYPLKKGVNVITVKKQGLFYIKYYVTDLKATNAKPIVVHIPEGMGNVNGFWDINKDRTDAEFARIHKNSTFKMLDIVGKNCHFIFTKEAIDKEKIVNVMNWYDNMVAYDLEIMGIDKMQKEGLINHRFVFVSYGSDDTYDASDYRSRYSESSLRTLFNEKTMSGNEWGPAHEIGHQLQEALNVHGCRESSNNLFANLFIHKLAKPSRGPGLQPLLDTCQVDGKHLQVPFVTLCAKPIMSRHFWQLYLYYNIVGKNTSFWPKYFELLRNASLFDGAPQSRFLSNYMLACEAAQEDLTEYFETWGYFVPIDREIMEYWKDNHTLTQQMIDEAIATVKSKKYPKAPPIQYIEDRLKANETDEKNAATMGDTGYYQYFKDNVKIKSTIAVAKNGDNFTVSNGEGAAAFELKSGNILLFRSIRNSFTISAAHIPAGAILYAVQVDGERIKIWKK